MEIWNDKVIPLIEEYFYNDWDKIIMLFGQKSKDDDGFIHYYGKDDEYSKALKDYDDEYPKVLRRINDMEKFQAALKKYFLE